MLFDAESFYDSTSLSLAARAGLKVAYLPVSIGFGSAYILRSSVPNRRMQRFQPRNYHQQWSGRGMCSGQPSCEVGAPQHPAEVA